MMLLFLFSFQIKVYLSGLETRLEDISPILLRGMLDLMYTTAKQTRNQVPQASWDVLAKHPLVLPPAPILYGFNELVKEMGK